MCQVGCFTRQNALPSFPSDLIVKAITFPILYTMVLAIPFLFNINIKDGINVIDKVVNGVLQALHDSMENHIRE